MQNYYAKPFIDFRSTTLYQNIYRYILAMLRSHSLQTSGIFLSEGTFLQRESTQAGIVITRYNRFRTGENENRRDIGQEGYRRGGKQHVRLRAGGIQDRRETGQVG